MSYEKDMQINLSRLEVELQEQADLVLKYGKEWSEKTKERDRAKENLAVVDSEIDAKTRKNWGELSDGKLTEKAVQGFVLKDKRHEEATEKMLDLSEEVNILSTVKIALEHRKKALEGLVSLYIAGYWSDPKVAKRDFDEVVSDKVKDEMEDALNKNKRMKKVKLRKKK